MKTLPQYHTVAEAAKKLNVCKDTVYKAAQTGELKGVKVTKNKRAPWRFTADDIQAYLEANTRL